MKMILYCVENSVTCFNHLQLYLYKPHSCCLQVECIHFAKTVCPTLSIHPFPGNFAWFPGFSQSQCCHECSFTCLLCRSVQITSWNLEFPDLRAHGHSTSCISQDMLGYAEITSDPQIFMECSRTAKPHFLLSCHTPPTVAVAHLTSFWDSGGGRSF
jgi:hypothetical protein